MVVIALKPQHWNGKFYSKGSKMACSEIQAEQLIGSKLAELPKEETPKKKK